MTYLIDFLGCKVNSYEVECIANELDSKGYTLFSEEKSPDIVLINTCSVTKTSGNKSKKMVRHYRNLYPNCILVVMGCDSQKDSAIYISEEVDADIVIGTSYRDKLFEFIEQFKKNRKKICMNQSFKEEKIYERLNLCKFTHQTRAYVKIQDGCDNYCTYCLIPYVRGRSRSRPKEDIFEEIKQLIENNYKEIVLTGIDMCSYGKDIYEKYNFSSLLGDILYQNPTLYRLRISSIEESQIDDRFIELLKKYPNIANHLHVPLQSGSASVLTRMNRKYDLDSFIAKINKIRSIRPNIALSTDVIVGFVGETDENFEETYNFCKKIKFNKIHVFPYSDREGTVGYKLTPKVSQEVKKERVAKLIALSDELGKEYKLKFKNKEIEFLFESYDEKTKLYTGHSSNFLEVSIKSEENLIDQIVKIKY